MGLCAQLHPNCHDKSNENIYVSSKQPTTTETHSIPSNYLIHNTDDKMKKKPYQAYTPQIR